MKIWKSTSLVAETNQRNPSVKSTRKTVRHGSSSSMRIVPGGGGGTASIVRAARRPRQSALPRPRAASGFPCGSKSSGKYTGVTAAKRAKYAPIRSIRRGIVLGELREAVPRD